MVLIINSEEIKSRLARKLLSTNKKHNKLMIYLTIILIILALALLVITIFPPPRIMALFNGILDHIFYSRPQ